MMVVLVLGRMSDSCNSVRILATSCFATLIRYMPLEGGVPNPPGIPQSILDKKVVEQQFLHQLFNNKQTESYKIPVKIKADLRQYQQVRQQI